VSPLPPMNLDHQYTVEDRGYATPCWIWQRALDSKGYGQVRVNGRLRRAPRVFYERAHGTIPEGMQIDHLCCNKGCVNPVHLEAVTGTENIRRSPATILTEIEVAQIKRLLKLGWAGQRIGRVYAISKHTVYNIRDGRIWKDIEAA